MIQLAPPSAIAPFLDQLGLEETLRLIEAFGGRRLYVHVRVDPEGELVERLGTDLANRLSQGFGGDTLPVPLVKAWRAGIYRARNWTIGRIASTLGMTERAVYKALGHGGSPRSGQLDLF